MASTPIFVAPSLTAGSACCDGELEAEALSESRSGGKRRKEQKRRDDLNKGLDHLMELIFLVDPKLKDVAMARASVERPSRSRTSDKLAPDSHLLSRVELVNHAAAMLARTLNDNEIHKGIIARLTSSQKLTAAVAGRSPDAFR